MDDLLIPEIRNCARCEGEHTKLLFTRMHTGTEWTHSALCPTNNTPILLKVVEADEG